MIAHDSEFRLWRLIILNCRSGLEYCNSVKYVYSNCQYSYWAHQFKRHLLIFFGTIATSSPAQSPAFLWPSGSFGFWDDATRRLHKIRIRRQYVCRLTIQECRIFSRIVQLPDAVVVCPSASDACIGGIHTRFYFPSKSKRPVRIE